MKNFRITSRRNQEIILVLHALSKLRGIRTKQEVLEYIREHQLYAIQPEDKVSYESKREWKSDTLLCWGRKDAVMEEWMIPHDERNSWDISRRGIEALVEIKRRFEKKLWDVRCCFMWTPKFKLIMAPDYQPSKRDWRRPPSRRDIMALLGL
jgi:hypothetical protein